MKRILSAILVVLLILASLPLSVLADGRATITYFRGFNIWESDGDKFSVSYYGEMSGDGWAFRKGVLTLNGFNGKYLTLGDECTIILTDGSVNNIEYGACFESDSVTSSSVTIQGDGILNLGNSLECVNVKLIIDGSTVNIRKNTKPSFEVSTNPYVDSEDDSYYKTVYDVDISAGGVHTKESGLELFYGSSMIMKKGSLNISDADYGIFVGDAEVYNGKISNSEITGGKISISNTDCAISIELEGKTKEELHEYQNNSASVFGGAKFKDSSSDLLWNLNDDKNIIELTDKNGTTAKSAYIDLPIFEQDEDFEEYNNVENENSNEKEDENPSDSNQSPSSNPNEPAKKEELENLETNSSAGSLSSVDYLAMSALAYLDWKEGDTVREKIPVNKSIDDTAKEITYEMLCENILDWKVLMVSSKTGTGFYSVVFCNEKSKEAVISFRGSSGIGDLLSKPFDVIDDWIINDLEFHAFHEYTIQLGEATEFYTNCKALMDKRGISSYNLSVTGHSLGGALAQVVSMTTGTYGEVFNSASVYEALYGNIPYVMSMAFKGADKWNFIAHISEGDSLVAKWKNEYKNLPYIVHENTHLGGLFYSHSLSNLIYVDSSTGKLRMSSLEAANIPDMFSEEDCGNNPLLYFGTSKDDKIVAALKINGLAKMIYGGDGNDTIMSHGATNDYLVGGASTKYDVLNGGLGDDTYIYHKGDGLKYIFDTDGKDTISILGLSNEDKLTVIDESTDNYKIIMLNDNPILCISTNRSSQSEYVIDAQGYANTLSIKGTWEKFYSYYIACPVDIDIIDPNGSVVLTLKNKEEMTKQTKYGNFYVFNEENGESHKRFDIIEGYSAKIRGVGEGTMDVVVLHDGENPNYTSVGAINIPVTTSTIATFNFTEGKYATLTVADKNGSHQEIFLRARKIITLDAGEGDLAATQVFTDFDGTVPELPVPLRAGYEFLGWTTKDATIISKGYKTEQDITLYASWKTKSTESPNIPTILQQQPISWVIIIAIVCFGVITSVVVLLLKRKKKVVDDTEHRKE